MSTDQIKPKAPKTSPIMAKGFARPEPFSSVAPQMPIAPKLNMMPIRSREVKEEKRKELIAKSVPIVEGAKPDNLFGASGRAKMFEYPQNGQALSVKL